MADQRNTIRKEISKRIKELMTEGVRKHQASEKARQEANAKYGHGWRHNLQPQSNIPAHEDETSPYYGHEHGEHWMD